MKSAMSLMDVVLMIGASTVRRGDLLIVRMGRSQMIGGGVRGMGRLIADEVDANE